MSNAEEKKVDNKMDPEYEIDTLTNEKLISDHEYDGIRELDNDLPPWWKWLFYLTIVFAIVYLIRLFVFQADDLIQLSEYDRAMANAASLTPAPSQSATFELKVLTDPASIANGKAIFDKICSVCHLADGGGLVGPNMTDDYWIHGNSIQDLFNTVTNGVLEKGMISYKDQFSPQQRLEVISYIITLHGTKPANPKAPQGTLIEWPY
jgi:cytochrome c oxidase cbb3-type subunit 3